MKSRDLQEKIRKTTIPQFDSQGNAVDKGIQLKNPKKKIPKMVEHLGEEIPKQAHVRCKIRHLKTERK